MPERKIGQSAHEDSSDRATIDLDDEQSAAFLEAACGKGSRIEDLFGLLKREGQRAVSIEEMNEAVVDQAAEDDERIKKG